MFLTLLKGVPLFGSVYLNSINRVTNRFRAKITWPLFRIIVHYIHFIQICSFHSPIIYHYLYLINISKFARGEH